MGGGGSGGGGLKVPSVKDVGKVFRDSATHKGNAGLNPLATFKNAGTIADMTGLGGKDPKKFNADYGGMPTRPEFDSALNGKNRLGKDLLLNPDLVKAGNLNVKSLTPDQRALAEMKSRALSKGASPWLKLQLEKEGMDRSANIDDAVSGAAGAGAQARSAMLMSGGLSGGARERLARNTASNINMARQGVNRQSSENRLNLGLADEGQKLDLLKMLPDAELKQKSFQADLNKYNLDRTYDASKFNATNKLDAKKFNTTATLDQIAKQNAFKLGAHSEDMKGWAAGKTGKAIANSTPEQGLFGKLLGGVF
jgi:hypothetical protein